MFDRKVWVLVAVGFFAGSAAVSGENGGEDRVAEGLRVLRGPVNGARVEREGKSLAVYGDPREDPRPADTVLFTHHRRDVVWAGRTLVERGAESVVPAAEVDHFTKVDDYWREFAEKRFHDYAQQTTKVLTRPLRVTKTVKGGDRYAWQDLEFRVLDTPGYTRGAVSYVVRIGDVVIAFTGDLIYGDGKLLDLYSLQDAIAEAQIRGYHGYAARLGGVISSLDKVAAEKPDVLVPARGPIIRDPAAAIANLKSRIHAFYRNYLSIDALRWYFKDAHILAKAERVLGRGAKVESMPMAETQELPAWVVPISNSRLILAADRSGFLVDCGGESILKEIAKLRGEDKLTDIEHIFVTHYHDDHTDRVARCVELYGATVHASRENWDVLERPAAYRLPAMTANPIVVSGRNSSGDRWRWREFDMTLYFFPGQTVHHDALLVKKDGGEEICFIGDSFTPSGIDDYCLLNRNFLHEGKGYFYCLETVRERFPNAFLVNQHVGPRFRYTQSQIDHMRETLKRRVELLRPLLPWDDPNWGLDEGWARFYPYGSEARPGERLTLEVRVWNHSPGAQRFHVRPHLPRGWRLTRTVPGALHVLPRQEGAVQLEVEVPGAAPPGLQVITADLRWDGWTLREWTEALVWIRR